VTVKLEVRNDGVAPIYGSWQPMLALFQEDQCALSAPAAIQIGEALPGRTEFTAWLDVPPAMQPGKYQLCFAIADPRTGEPVVRLAMRECGEDLWTRLGSLTVE
jgi:hypothetical protein